MRVVIFLAGLVLATVPGLAAAECSKATLKGNYGTTGAIEATDDFETLQIFFVGRVVFNGKGKLSIKKGTASAYGTIGDYTGNGTYSLNKNCVGTATINLRSEGEPAGTMRMDMIVVGTQENHRVMAVYTNQDDEPESGQFIFEKIEL